MSLLDQVREKYRTPREGTDKTDKRASVSSVSPQDRDSESFFDENASNEGVGILVNFDQEKARRDAKRRDEARRTRLEPVLKLMAEDDQAREFYSVTDDNADPDYVILVFAIRGKGSGELSIPRETYDGLKLLEILEGVASEARGNK